ncbi:uncharacterized protein LOC134835880 [Culicoides brevitarsis]|uniref:uncharacterized protein LOC134835880 n=1 Tax=Culicoides brevitarsis TaxID=469753 RepID=UPI00307B7078
MTDQLQSEIKSDFCRICNKNAVNLRHIYNDEQSKNEILPKIHIVFPHILIYENDPLPKGICENCELFIYATHEKLVEFNKVQQNLVSGVTDVDYLNGFVEIKSLLDRIQGIKVRQALQNVTIKTKVKSLSRICIDFFNKNGPSMLDTYLKCDKNPAAERNVRKRSHKRVSYKGFGDKKRKRAPSTNVVRTEKVEKPKKLPPEPPSETQETVSNDEGGPATRRRSRALSRVNYVDDIPDSVLFYDEIQAAKRRKLEEKVILESIKEASRHPNTEVFQNPHSQIQINAAMSIPSMEFDDLAPEIVFSKCKCRHCGLICDNLKILAIHNMKHLSVRLQKIGEKMTLPANLRRGVMFREDRYRVVRCTSCLRTFRNADQIKEHWNSQNCDFYCKICYASFHQNPEMIDDHLFRAHGVRRQRHQRPVVKPLVRLEPRDKKIKVENDVSPSPPSGFKLKVKSVSMINASAPLVEPPQEHFTPLQDQTFDESANLMYTTPNFAAQTYLNPSLVAQNAVRAVCHICHCSFPNINSRNSHMKAHKQFVSTSSMSQMPSPYAAMPSVGPSMDFAANYTPCGFVYYNRAEFLQHRSECKDCRYACMVCSKPFQAGSELQMHMMLQHPRSLTFKR